MFTAIVESLQTALAVVFEMVMNIVMKALAIDLSSYIQMFPVLEDAYRIAQAFGVSLVWISAMKSLSLFWIGAVDKGAAKDQPAAVLIRAFIATLGIYYGAYFLDMLVTLAKAPYDTIVNIFAGNPLNMLQEPISGTFLLMLLGETVNWGIGSTLLKVIDLGVAFGSIILGLIITGNIFRLLIEICERWLLVGILFYTSPMIYWTLPSSETTQVFKKWCTMFIGALLQMSISVLFLKIIISGFTPHEFVGSGTFYPLQLLMILAMTKIAQRTDTYLSQLGVGVALTGSNLMEDMIAAARIVTRPASRGSRPGVVSGGNSGGESIVGGRTPIGAGVQRYVASRAAGRTRGQAVKDAVAEFSKRESEIPRGGLWKKYESKMGGNTRADGEAARTAGNKAAAEGASKAAESSVAAAGGGAAAAGGGAAAAGGGAAAAGGGAAAAAGPVGLGVAAGVGVAVGIGKRVKNLGDAVNQSGDRKRVPPAQGSLASKLPNGKGSDVGKGYIGMIARMVAPNAVRTAEVGAARVNEMMNKFTDSKSAANHAITSTNANMYSVGSSELPNSIREKVAQGKDFIGKQATDNLANFGVRDAQSGHAIDINANGDVTPSATAKAAGVSIQNGIMTDTTGGRSVANVLASNEEGKARHDLSMNTVTSRNTPVNTLSQAMLHPNADGSDSDINRVMAQRVFGDLLPEGSTVTGFSSSRMNDSQDENGNTVHGGTRIGLTYQTADGNTGYANIIDAQEMTADYTQNTIDWNRIETADGRIWLSDNLSGSVRNEGPQVDRQEQPIPLQKWLEDRENLRQWLSNNSFT